MTFQYGKIEPDSEPPKPRKPKWQMWEEGIPHHVIDDFVEKFENEIEPLEASFGITSEHEVRDDLRQAQVRLVDNYPGIQNLLVPFINQANENAFRFDIEKILWARYTIYGRPVQPDYMSNATEWHHDINYIHEKDHERKLTVHVQMSDDHESKGGDFMFKWAENPPPDALRKKGTVLVFPSYLEHRISKVTDGSNKHITAWVIGPSWR